MTHRTFSRRGGKARSPAKTLANRAKASSYWNAVRQGLLPAPRQPRKPPSLDEISRRLAPFCRTHGIRRLEAFGSVAREDTRRGSDVDLLATFNRMPGLQFFALQEQMARLLGVPVHLLTRAAVEQMSNRVRRDSILADARVIYDG